MKKLLHTLFTTSFCFASLSAQANTTENYRRASDDPESIKDMIYPRQGKIELSIPAVGFIMNQSFVDTYLIHAGLTYFGSSEWGYGLEFSLALNQDKNERACLETFFNDPNDDIDADCAAEGGDAELQNNIGNYGPAYMPIRELKYLIAANMVWNPVYGKQLFFMSLDNHFEFFTTMGLGLAFSDFYEQRETLNNGEKSRGVHTPAQGSTPESMEGGAEPEETNSYGEAGRPEAISETHPYINLGIGQRFHFAKSFNIHVELRNMTLLATPGGFENLIALWGGFGYRF